MQSKIRPDEAVLIFGDLQFGIVDLPLTMSLASLERSIWGLARLGEIFDIPTLAMTVPTADGTAPRIIPEIERTRSRFQRFLRYTPDSFENDEFCKAIEETGRKTLIVCGVATEVCVHWLVLSGRAKGYDVYVVVDACGGLGVRSEEAAFRRFEAAGAVMSSVASLAGELAGNFTRPPATEVLAVIYKMIGDTAA